MHVRAVFYSVLGLALSSGCGHLHATQLPTTAESEVGLRKAKSDPAIGTAIEEATFHRGTMHRANRGYYRKWLAAKSL